MWSDIWLAARAKFELIGAVKQQQTKKRHNARTLKRRWAEAVNRMQRVQADKQVTEFKVDWKAVAKWTSKVKAAKINDLKSDLKWISEGSATGSLNSTIESKEVEVPKSMFA